MPRLHPGDQLAQALAAHLIKTLAALIPAQAEVAALAAVEGALAEQETQIPTMAALAAMASLRQLPGLLSHTAAEAGAEDSPEALVLRAAQAAVELVGPAMLPAQPERPIQAAAAAALVAQTL